MGIPSEELLGAAATPNRTVEVQHHSYPLNRLHTGTNCSSRNHRWTRVEGLG